MAASDSAGQKPRRRLAFGIAGAAALICIAGIMLYPVCTRPRERSRQLSCLSNVRQIAIGMLSYAKANDGRLPDSPKWTEQVLPYVIDYHPFECPTAGTLMRPAYAVSRQWSGAKLAEIPDKETAIVVYEVDATGAPTARHSRGMNVGFADGHAKWVPRTPVGLGHASGGQGVPQWAIQGERP